MQIEDTEQNNSPTATNKNIYKVEFDRNEQ